MRDYNPSAGTQPSLEGDTLEDHGSPRPKILETRFEQEWNTDYGYGPGAHRDESDESSFKCRDIVPDGNKGHDLVYGMRCCPQPPHDYSQRMGYLGKHSSSDSSVELAEYQRQKAKTVRRTGIDEHRRMSINNYNRRGRFDSSTVKESRAIPRKSTRRVRFAAGDDYFENTDIRGPVRACNDNRGCKSTDTKEKCRVDDTDYGYGPGAPDVTECHELDYGHGEGAPASPDHYYDSGFGSPDKNSRITTPSFGDFHCPTDKAVRRTRVESMSRRASARLTHPGRRGSLETTSRLTKPTSRGWQQRRASLGSEATTVTSRWCSGGGGYPPVAGSHNDSFLPPVAKIVEDCKPCQPCRRLSFE